MATDTKKINFLGKKALIDRLKPTDEAHAHQWKLINGFVETHPVEVTCPDIGLMHASALRLLDSYVTLDDCKYYPVEVLAQWQLGKKDSIPGRRTSTYNHYNFVYITKLGRPNIERIVNKLASILSKDFPGEREILCDRYVFVIPNLDKTILNKWLDIAKNGDGSVIDYSWIAPLQDYILEFEEEVLKLKTRFPKGNNSKYNTPNSGLKEQKTLPKKDQEEDAWADTPMSGGLYIDHMAQMGQTIYGDALYGQKSGAPGIPVNHYKIAVKKPKGFI
jgi:hypothetical protein